MFCLARDLHPFLCLHWAAVSPPYAAYRTLNLQPLTLTRILINMGILTVSSLHSVHIQTPLLERTFHSTFFSFDCINPGIY